MVGERSRILSLGVSILAIIVSVLSAYFTFIGQVSISAALQQSNLAVAGTQSAVSGGQLCLNWATFVGAQRAAGMSDEQIDRTGQVIFGAPDVMLVEVVRVLHGDYTGTKPKHTDTKPKDVQNEYNRFVQEVQRRQPSNSIVSPNLSNGFSILSFCGSAETFRAARDGKQPIIPLQQLGDTASVK